MKIISTIGRILWAFVSFLLWYSAIVFPILCLLLTISIFSNFLGGYVTSAGFEPETLGEKVYLLFITLAMSAVGILYVTKYRKKVPDRRDLKYVFVSALLICFLLVQGYQVHHYKKSLHSVKLSHVLIKCFDYDSREPVPITLNTPGHSYQNPFPQIRTTSVISKTNELRLSIVSDKEVKVQVSSEGYGEKELHIGRESDEIEVYLKKLSSN